MPGDDRRVDGSGGAPAPQYRAPRNSILLWVALGCGLTSAAGLPFAKTSVHNPGMLLALASIPLCLAGIVTGIVGLVTSRGPEVTNRGLGLMGLVFSIITGVLWLGIFRWQI